MTREEIKLKAEIYYNENTIFDNKLCCFRFKKEPIEALMEFANEINSSWHNLIKEPEKLPEYDKIVEIWIKGMDFPNSACRESLGGGEWRWWVYWGSGYEIGNKSAVIAWREIEKPQF